MPAVSAGTGVAWPNRDVFVLHTHVLYGHEYGAPSPPPHNAYHHNNYPEKGMAVCLPIQLLTCPNRVLYFVKLMTSTSFVFTKLANTMSMNYGGGFLYNLVFT